MATIDVDPAVAELSRRLLPEADSLAEGMMERILAAVPGYAGGDLVPVEDVLASCQDNMRYVLGSLAGVVGTSADAPRTTGARRAGQGVPYAMVLQAFRVGGRFVWELLVERADDETRDVLLRAAADIWSVTDDLSSAVTESYRTALVEQVRRDAQRRAVLVSALLDGDSAVADHEWEAAGVLGLKGSEYVVVSAECPSTGAEAIVAAESTLARQNLASAWRLDHDHHEGLIALRPGFGVTALTEVLARVATGRVGVSAPIARLDEVVEACRQARVAAAAGTPGRGQVVRFDQEPMGVLLAGSPQDAASLVRAILGPVLELPSADAQVLLETARTWLASGGSTSTAARELHLHRNTVRYRLRRLEEFTGRDLSHPGDAAQVYVALEGARILGLG